MNYDEFALDEYLLRYAYVILVPFGVCDGQVYLRLPCPVISSLLSIINMFQVRCKLTRMVSRYM